MTADDVIGVQGDRSGGPSVGRSSWGGHSRLAGLARRGVEAAAALGSSDPEWVAQRLYCWYRIPLTPHWCRVLPDPALLLASVGGWRRPVPTHRSGGWLSLARGDADAAGRDRAEFPYKLYLSPAPDAVARIVPAAADAAVRAGVVRFKVGADPVGLLRPDKIVFYARNAVELTALASELAAALVDVPAHGVPFTAPLSADGLLSWAGDPIDRVRESWRLAVCRSLAANLVRGGSPDAAIAALPDRGVRLPDFAPVDLESPQWPDPVGPAAPPPVPAGASGLPSETLPRRVA